MRFSPRRCLLLAILLCLMVGAFLGIYLTRQEELNEGHVRKHAERLPEESILLQKLKPAPKFHHGSSDNRDSNRRHKIPSSKRRPAPSKTKNPVRVYPMVVDNTTLWRLKEQYPFRSKQFPSYDVQAFYYTWYGNPQWDGKYYHWNHPFLPHWNKKEKLKWRLGRHEPPEDIGSNFYPKLGSYSSKDLDVIAQHMVQMRTARIGVLSLSWYPPNLNDDEGNPTDGLVPVVLDIANVYDIKVNFHVEPYKDRSPRNVRDNVQYILENYGGHPAFYRRRHKGRLLPVFYIYDSYTISADDWGTILKPQGLDTVRDTDLDGLFIGLLVDKQHEVDIVSGGFDGFYTYFASNRFTFGSSWGNWPHLASFARARDLLFIPSVGPGYIDTEVRPWNGANTKSRDRGRYYESGFKAAMGTMPSIITITSFNEWHEGTQIEPAVIKKRGKEDYLSYVPGRPDFYLDLTQKFVTRFLQQKTRGSPETHV